MIKTDLQPKLSIITVNLNNAAGLRKTIESVISQTFTDYEYLIIDGGSTDGSLDIIKEFADRMSYWVSEPDGGIYNAMNKGIAWATGDWIIFMNSGDVFRNIEVLENVFNRNIEAKTQILYGNTLVKGLNKLVEPPAKITKDFFLTGTICHQSLFARRDLFDRIGNFNYTYKIISDKEWLLHVYISKNHFTYLNLDISIWDPIGFSSKNHDLFYKELKTLEKQYFSSFEILIFRIKNKYMKYKNKLNSNRKIFSNV